MMGWRWLKPGEDPPPVDLSMLTSSNFKKFEEQRQAAAKAARQMSAQSNFYDADSDGEGESDESESSDDFGCATGVSQKLRHAVTAFNIKSDEDGCRLQWFQETIDGPLEVLQVQAEHRKACDLCDNKPTFGEVYFKYNMHGPYEYSKLCESCGMGVLHAALLSAEDSGEEELEEEEEEEGALEQEGEDEVSEGAPESKSVQPAKAKRAAARGKPSKQDAAANVAAGSLARGKRGPPPPPGRKAATQPQPKKRRGNKE